MREIAIGFICFAGMMVLGLWTLAVVLAIKSGKGILSLFKQQHKYQWLPIDDTIAQYGSDHQFE